MAKQIKQIRYYGDEDARNYPPGLVGTQLTSGSIFNETPSITQLGIQSYPGLKFSLNDGMTPIILGSTGIYELDVDGFSQINRIIFAQDSINKIKIINNAYLIIDYVFEGGV